MTGGLIRMLTWRYEKHTGKFLRMTGELVSEETQLVEINKHFEGAQWLSGRVLDSRWRGCGFKPHRRHLLVSLSKTH